MLEIQREIIDRFMSELKSDVIPNDMLPYLLCLTEDDRESIQWKQNQEGPRAAVLVLLQRLKRRPDSFEQFLTALEYTGCKHLKELLQSSVPSEHVVITPTTETRNLSLQAPTIHIVTSPTAETMCPLKSPVIKQTVTSPTAETMCPLKSPVIKQTVTSPTAETRSPGFQAPAIPTVTSPTAETTCCLETSTTEHTVTSPMAETKNPLMSPVTENTVTSPTAETMCSLETPTTEHTVTSPTAETTCSLETPTTEHTVTSPTAETMCPIESPTTAHTVTENVTSPMTETRSPTQSNSASRETENCDHKYDIYICYCSEDLDIARELRDVMKKEYHLNVCIDFIDFMPGAAISDNICNSIQNSKAIVFLLSPEFLDKKWARWELQHALHDSLIDHQKKMFPVLLKKCSVPKELELCYAIDLQGANKTVRAEGWKRLAATVKGSRGSRSLIEKFTSLMKLN